ncbi:MAG: carbohydrate ABC transporter permease [Bacteroidota bacterium]
MSNGLNVISRRGNFILNIFFMLCAVTCVYPLLLVVGVSLSEEQSILKYGYSVIPHVFSLKGYEYIFNNSAFLGRTYILTIFVTVVGTVLSTLIIALFAYPISRKEFKFRRFFTFFALFTMIFKAGMVPWYFVCVKFLHIQNTIWALILPYLINAWFVIIMRTFFMTTIPDEVLESAKIDGAGEIRTFFSIVIPLSLPGLATIALFNTLAYWNDWWLCLMLITDQALYNVQFTLYQILNNLQYLNTMAQYASPEQINRLPSETARMAMAIVAIGPVVLAYPFLQRFFVKGLVVGAIKG